MFCVSALEVGDRALLLYSFFESTADMKQLLNRVTHLRRGMGYKLLSLSFLGSITTFSLVSSEDVSCLHVHYGFPCVGWECKWAQG